EIIWNASDAPKNRWLEVIVEGNDAAGGFNTNTGLAASDIFFFGNRIGDTGSGTATLAQTTAADEIAARNNQGAGGTVTNIFDFDRSGTVTASDQIISRNNVGTLTKINISSPPAAPQAMVASARGDGSGAAVASALTLQRSVSRPLEHPWVARRLASEDHVKRASPPSVWDRQAVFAAVNESDEAFELDDELIEALVGRLGS